MNFPLHVITVFDKTRIMWLWCFFNLIVITISRESVAENRNLCDVCDCLPASPEPSYVNCNCKKVKVLIMEDTDYGVLSSVKSMNISGCTYVSFPAKGFTNAKKLKSVQIRQLELVHFNANIFPAASNLVIEDVNELIMDKVVNESSLVNIEIKNVRLNEVVENLFEDWPNLEKLVFQNVSIKNIRTNSMAISAGSQNLSVKLSNCKIETIHPRGIGLEIAKLELHNTTVNVIDPDGLYVSAENVEITRCTFGSISSNGFLLRANKVNIIENEFKSVTTNLLRDIEVLGDKNKVYFVGNTIYDVDFSGFILSSKIGRLHFTKNKIVCECTPRKVSLLKLRDLFPGLLSNDSFVDTVIDTTSCKNYNGMPLSEFKRRFLSGTICNETDLKQLEMYEQSELINLRQSNTEISPNPNSSVSLYSYCTLFLVCVLLNICSIYAY